MMVKSSSHCRLLFVLLLIVAAGCGKRELVPLDYVQWVEDEENGLKQTRFFGDYEIHVQYKPVEYIVALEKKDPELKEEVLDERKKELDGFQYYHIRYSITDKSKDFMKYNIRSEQEYYERMNYLSFGFQNDIRLFDGKDTLPCVLFNCVRNYGLSPHVDFEVGFEKSTENRITDQTLIIDDQLMGIGTIKFSFTNNAIINTPSIRTL